VSHSDSEINSTTASPPDSAPVEVKPAFPQPAARPTQAGPHGITYDFNHGIRVSVPKGTVPWRIRLSDLDTGNILFETPLDEGFVTSSKRYFVRGRIEVWSGETSVFTHAYECRDRRVLIQFPVGTLGDSLGWLPYAIRFAEHHGCRLTCTVAPWLLDLFRPAYPDVTFLEPEAVNTADFYASYTLGLFFDDKECVYQPCDFRLVGLHRTAGYILGIDPTEAPPRIAVDEGGPPISEPYVCIAVQSSTQAKYWNNPAGWREVVQFLKDSGYRVICIDKQPLHGHELLWNHIPWGAEDQTGDRPLSERARWLKHATCFIGLSSGLSWLAWATGTPVVMISGFTHPTNEFHTPYRVINYHACNSCWNDPGLRFDHHDFQWCPRHKGTPRHFECSRLITAEQVKTAIQRIPGFASKETR